MPEPWLSFVSLGLWRRDMKESKAFDYFKAWLLFFLIANSPRWDRRDDQRQFCYNWLHGALEARTTPCCSDRCSRVSKAICSLC
jgi:hypothetical protein